MGPDRGAGVAALVVLVGPTAAGKSALGERLAELLGGEIVSADAFQVYRGLDVGTAKPSPAVRRRIRYHCVDLLPPTARCTAAEFARLARAAIERIRARGRVPLLVGGSGFYVEVTVDGLTPMPASDARWRDALERVCARRGVAWMHAALARLDPEWAARIGLHDRQRVLRAMEVLLRTGRRLRQLRARRRPAGLEPLGGPVVWLGLNRPRPILHERIERRVGAMLAAGWVAEVERLLAAGVSPRAHAFQAIGYREIVAHLVAGVPLEVTRERIVAATRRFARRQLTWLRRNRRIEWWNAEEVDAESLAHRLGGRRCSGAARAGATIRTPATGDADA